MQYWPYCTQVLVDTLQEAWRAEGRGGGRTVITSDVYGDTSGTWGLPGPWWGSRTPAKRGPWRETWGKAVPPLKQAVRELLEESLERIHANASSAATYLEQQGLRGSEEAAAEQLLCARADILVMCTRREGCACGRGLESGFVALTKYGDISNWDVSNVTDMEGMFHKATSFNQPLNKWNVSNVEYMVAMFANANSFNQPLNNWNVSKVESMVGMFDEATSFNQPLHAPWYAVEQSDSE